MQRKVMIPITTDRTGKYCGTYSQLCQLQSCNNSCNRFVDGAKSELPYDSETHKYRRLKSCVQAEQEAVQECTAWNRFSENRPNDGTVFLVNLCEEHTIVPVTRCERWIGVIRSTNLAYRHYHTIDCPHCYWMYLPDVPDVPVQEIP